MQGPRAFGLGSFCRKAERPNSAFDLLKLAFLATAGIRAFLAAWRSDGIHARPTIVRARERANSPASKETVAVHNGGLA